MQCTNFFKAIPLSFFSAKFYREVSQCWRARSFLYLLILLLLCWVFIAFTQTSFLNRVINIEGANFIKQTPTIYFNQGEASIKQPSPVLIKWADSNIPLAIIDMQGEQPDLVNSQANILLTKRNVFIKLGSDQMFSYPYPHGLKGIITTERLNNFFIKMKKKLSFFIYIALYIFGLFISYIYHLILALLYGAVGLNEHYLTMRFLMSLLL